MSERFHWELLCRHTFTFVKKKKKGKKREDKNITTDLLKVKITRLHDFYFKNQQTPFLSECNSAEDKLLHKSVLAKICLRKKTTTTTMEMFWYSHLEKKAFLLFTV